MKNENFKNELSFLSNFYECDVMVDGINFTNSESAFHSYKDLSRQLEFKNLNPKEAKKLGRKVNLRKDWEKVKDNIMYKIVFAKFIQNEDLKKKLILTDDSKLIEYNYWHDNYWGICTCDKCRNIQGKNKLGNILKQVKNKIIIEDF